MSQRAVITNASRSSVAAVAALGALLLGGCNGALIGNVVVLAVTLGIFFGTLGLGRASSGMRSRSERSASDASASSEMSTPGA